MAFLARSEPVVIFSKLFKDISRRSYNAKRQLLKQLDVLCPLCERSLAATAIKRSLSSSRWHLWKRPLESSDFRTSPDDEHEKNGDINRTSKLRLLDIDAKIDSAKMVAAWRDMTVSELAEALDKDVGQVLEALSKVDENERHDYGPNSELKTISIRGVAKEFGCEVEMVSMPVKARKTDDMTLPLRSVDPKSMEKRPPVVTIMGHVDHGKTSLLDALRHSSIVSQEFGGITQHIGAFSVKVASGKTVTFFDTPGHGVFSAMRERGVTVTDIVVLVVAADEGVKEQTVQSIEYAQKAKVPIIVAFNKIDKNAANVEMCKEGLLRSGVRLKEFGGDVQAVEISATEGTHLDQFVETLLTQAELMDLKSDPKTSVQATVIESRRDPTRGKLSTALIQHGTLRKGSHLVAGTASAKVRSMFDEHGQAVSSVGPGYPIEIVGWKTLPAVGEKIYEVDSEKQAVKIAKYYLDKEKQKRLLRDLKVISEKRAEHARKHRAKMLRQIERGTFEQPYAPPTSPYLRDDVAPRFKIVVKGDVDGSVDAISDALLTYASADCKLDVARCGVGEVTPDDVDLATAFCVGKMARRREIDVWDNGHVYAFNVPVSARALELADSRKVPIKHFNIIYEMFDDIKKEISARLPLIVEEKVLGEARVLEEFLVGKGYEKWPAAGSKCETGNLMKSANFRVLRDDRCVHQGKVVSLHRVKTELNVIVTGVECEIRFEDVDVRFSPGDKIQCYETVEIKRTTDWNPC